MTVPAPSLFEALRAALAECDPEAKAALAIGIARGLEDGALAIDGQAQAPERVDDPGRPAKPALVAPRDVPSRGLGSVEGRAGLLHAVAHIEFNAINLALDAAWRFRGMPRQFYLDWTSVAADEARHFRMLRVRLEELGYEYGGFAAHNGLWEMARKSAYSCLARMALVPRLLEARGLDVTPGMIARLRGQGDHASVAVLETILAEEIGHVAIGSRWFAWCCEREGKAPGETFLELLHDVARGAIRGPFNLEARRAAGFDDAELAKLAALAGAA
ncbi:MAG: ferritin-like domain-containing protein [Arenimonas sp.]